MQHTPLEASARAQDFWSRHLSWRRPFEIAVWVLVFAVAAAANVAVILIDAHRDGLPVQAWQPMVSEGSSALVSLLLVPPLLWLCERWPLHADTWLRRLPVYAVASLAWSLLHVAGMVLLRTGAYALMGDAYSFDWRIGLPYEYIKDVQTFSLIVFVAHGYSWLWRRLQGEAHLLGQTRLRRCTRRLDGRDRRQNKKRPAHLRGPPVVRDAAGTQPRIRTSPRPASRVATPPHRQPGRRRSLATAGRIHPGDPQQIGHPEITRPLAGQGRLPARVGGQVRPAAQATRFGGAVEERHSRSAGQRRAAGHRPGGDRWRDVDPGVALI